MSVEFQGLDNINSMLESLGNTEEIKRAMGRACALVERTAKENAIKGTGELRRSITSKVEDSGGDVIGIVFTPLEYAPYVEYGTGLFAEKGGRQDVPWHYQDDEGRWHTTSGMKPQPFLRPALNVNREEIVRLLQGGLTNND